jgi:hypothetical protein
MSRCKKLVWEAAASTAVYSRRRFFKVKSIRVAQFLFTMYVRFALVLVGLMMSFRVCFCWLARDVMLQMRGFLHDSQEFCWLRVRQLVFFSRLHDKYNLEKQRMAHIRKRQCIAAEAHMKI